MGDLRGASSSPARFCESAYFDGAAWREPVPAWMIVRAIVGYGLAALICLGAASLLFAGLWVIGLVAMLAGLGIGAAVTIRSSKAWSGTCPVCDSPIVVPTARRDNPIGVDCPVCAARLIVRNRTFIAAPKS